MAGTANGGVSALSWGHDRVRLGDLSKAGASEAKFGYSLVGVQVGKCGPRACGGGPIWESPKHSAGLWSPRMRGWSAHGSCPSACLPVVPAHAGVVRYTAGALPPLRGGPRACGGGPCRHSTAAYLPGWSPRMRGWSAAGVLRADARAVVPAHAGVVRRPDRPQRGGRGGSRACGGGPRTRTWRASASRWSPRMRGWSERALPEFAAQDVVPAHAGVVRGVMAKSPPVAGGPRACGGGPSGPSVNAASGRVVPAPTPVGTEQNALPTRARATPVEPSTPAAHLTQYG